MQILFFFLLFKHPQETFAIKSSTRVGYLNAILAQGGGGGGNLNEPVIKSSNSWGVACGDVEIWN